MDTLSTCFGDRHIASQAVIYVRLCVRPHDRVTWGVFNPISQLFFSSNNRDSFSTCGDRHDTSQAVCGKAS